MQESIGFDFEDEPTRSIAPPRRCNATAVIVMSRRRTEYGEAPETVVTLDIGGRGIQSAPLQGLPECQLVPTTKRRVCFVIRADVVAVPSTYRTVARVKLVPHFSGCRDPHVRWKNRVECAPQLLNVSPPSFGHPNTNGLTSRMNTGIRSARSQGSDWRGTEPRQCLLQNALNGSLSRLALPPAEPGAVVVQHELHSALGHCAKTTNLGGCVKQRYIDTQ